MKYMNRLSKIGSAALMLALLLTFSLGCGNVDRDFKTALQTNTEEAFQVFIKQHPDGPYAAKVRVILDKVAVRKLDSDYAAKHKQAEDKLTTDRNEVDELSQKQIPVKMQTHLGSRPGEPMIWMREEPDEEAAAQLKSHRNQAQASLTADKQALDRLEADYVAANRQELAKLEADKRLVSDPEFLSHLGDQYGTNTFGPPNGQR